MIFKQQEVQFISGEMNNQKGIFKDILKIVNLTNSICSLEVNGKLYTEEKSNFIFTNNEIENKWNYGDVIIEEIK
ncbi:hypothetical protein [Alkaliphilus sp. B6464]|uniref:hypothetical protein n=1 Tax=Alkaliphilus sp. B6464 TaxID=2731219 RepID=UPI001BAAAB2D|nr:hypothetical protein [Alkaliphilus sp. B6464]QUH21973.1 hypothetical protein HYG84_18890 [Alkaliphilus sp. B6464]